MPHHVSNAIVMFDRALGPKLDSGVPIVSRVLKSHTVPESGSHQALRFHKEELVYELSAPKKGWVLIKKMDPASSIVVWVPKICLTEPEIGPYRVKHTLVEHDGRQIPKGEILQITRIDRSGLWSFQKIEGKRPDGFIDVINPKHIEKADIETEPPGMDLSKRHLLFKAVVSSGHIGSVGGQVKRLLSREKKVAETKADDPPPY